MAKLLKLRRGTTTQHGSFTGAEGEVTIDTDKDTAVVHDGSTAGGRPLAREDLNNVSSSTIAGRLSNDSIAPAKIGAGTLPSDVTVASANLVNGTIVNADIASNAAIAGTKLENSGVTAGSYGSSSAIPIVTVDAQGLVTAASTTAIDSTTIANGTSSVSVANNADITINRSGTDRVKVNNGGLQVLSGNFTNAGNSYVLGGNVYIQAATPILHLQDTNDNPDYEVKNQDGTFVIRDATNSADRLFINTDGHTDIKGNLDCEAGVDVTGEITSTGNITVTSNSPTLNLTDSDHNSDYKLNVNAGLFQIRDATNDAYRIKIASDGTVDIGQNLNANGGLDVTGNITVTGTVDGRDVAADGALLDGITNPSTIGEVKSTATLADGVVATTQAASDNSTKVATTAYVTTGIANAQAFPSGTKMLFQQTSAPTGWTKVTSGVDNKALRVVSGTAGSGGSNAFSNTLASRSITANSANATATGSIALGNATAGGNITVANTTAGGNLSIDSASTGGTVNSHTLSTNEMPSHRHIMNRQYNTGNQYQVANEGGLSFSGQTIQWSNYVHYQQTLPFLYTNYVGGGGGHSHGFTGGSHTHSGTMSGTAHTHNASFTGTAHSHSASFSGSAHNHSISVTNLDLEVQYLDVIIASKD